MAPTGGLPLPNPAGKAGRTWSTLAAYYRQCLEREQMQRLQVSLEQKGYALLRNLSDEIITRGAPMATISDSSALQQVRQLLARKTQEQNRSLYYGFPLVSQQRSLIPVCYTQVSVEPGAQPGSLLLRREGDLLANRRFLTESGDLTDAEVAAFARQLDDFGPVNARLRDLLGDGVITPDGMLFYADPDVMTRSLLRELEWLERQSRLSPPLATYIQDSAPAPVLAPTQGVTVARSNPAQDRVLRSRSSVLQVVAGPPGTGKTQTIINLIASTVCDGKAVLFISKNNTAVDNVYDAFLEQELFPGILRLGSQEVRARTLDYFKNVIGRVSKPLPVPDDQADFREKGLALSSAIARLEEELAEGERLRAQATEMSELRLRTDETLRESGLYRFATDLAQLITPANAGSWQPEQLVGLRRLVAGLANWLEPPESFWGRLLARLGILERTRLGRLQQGLNGLHLPIPYAPRGQGLAPWLDGLLRLEAVYPFLLASARELHARQQLAGKRQSTAIQSDLDKTYGAKVEHDRRRLSRRWTEILHAAHPRVAQLQELVPLFEKIASGTADTDTRRTWWRRFGDLLAVFPVICSTNLSLARAAPNESERFDLVILDEASQSDIPSFLPALYRASRACVVGDEKQLSHISNLGDEEDKQLMAAAGITPADTLSYHRHSAFDRAIAVSGRAGYTLLDRHYRCVPEIIGFCNEQFYDGRLKIERTPEYGQTPRGSLPLRGFIIDGIDGQTEYRAATASRSARNTAEADRVMGLARTYIAAGVTDIGIVTPLRAQRELLEQLRARAVESEPDAAIRAALGRVEIGTIHTFQGGQHQLMLFSTVVAPGAREGTVRWFEENRNLLNVAISRAKDLLVVVCHRPTLEKTGGILKAMVAYADARMRPSGSLPPLPPGLQPERLGLLSSEAAILREWLNPPGAVAEVLNQGEQVLYRELSARVAGRGVLLAPKMRVLDTLEPAKVHDLSQQERDYAFRAHFDLVLVNRESFKPVAAVELDGATHTTDPLTMARDRLKNSICDKAGLPLVRVRWGGWGALEALNAILSPESCR